MHLDLESDNVEAEVQRLEALGATRWDHQQERGYDFWVMRDPWSNEFCVLQPEFPNCSASGDPADATRLSGRIYCVAVSLMLGLPQRCEFGGQADDRTNFSTLGLSLRVLVRERHRHAPLSFCPFRMLGHFMAERTDVEELADPNMSAVVEDQTGPLLRRILRVT
jgi:hypothetical protein